MRTARIADVATIERTVVHPNRVDASTNYIGLEHIARGGRIIGRETAGRAGLSSAKFRFTSEHVLFGKLRPNLGKVSRPQFDGICSTDILPILPGSDLDRGYLAHFLSQPRMVRFAASQATGANLPRLSPTTLGQFLIPLPTVSEQRRVAAILDQADALRTSYREILLRLDTLAMAVLHRLMEGAAEMVDLGDLIVDGPANGLYMPVSAYGSGVPIIRIESFDDGRLNGHPLKRLNASRSDTERFGVQAGDILINRVNSLTHLGKSLLVPTLSEPTVYESNIMRIRVDPNQIIPAFVNTWLRSENYKSQIRGRAKKAINQASINQSDVRSLQIPKPSREEQRDFAGLVQQVEARRLVTLRALASHDELFASLQSRAFRGEL